MKGYNLWSYHPYRPILDKVGDIYISRIAPGEHSIHFEWLYEEGKEYSVYYRTFDDKEYTFHGKIKGGSCDIEGLEYERDYAFYVECEGKKSRARFARCGTCPGTVVNYLHPQDPALSFSGRYLCSPSLLRHPDGYLLASMDVYEGSHPQNLTLIFRSDDDGETWHYVSELMPCFWGNMFIHRGELYMIACSTEYGDLLIGKSTDGGKTFCAPVSILRGINGKCNEGVHRYPQKTYYYGGRIYQTLEWASNEPEGHYMAAMVMSCDENDDLLVPENWSFTDVRKFDKNDPLWEGLDSVPENFVPKNFEGTLVTSPEGKLLNIMRYIVPEQQAMVYEVDTKDHEAPLKYSYRMDFPANYSKFTIRFDDVSGRYYTLASRYEKEPVRNLISLMYSTDLKKWEVASDVLDYRDRDPQKVGVQYVDFHIEGDDILFLCRTAINGANSFHDSNYSTFHRIKKFRDL